MTETREPLGIERLVETLDLTNVTFYEVAAKLAEGDRREELNRLVAGSEDGSLPTESDWGARFRHIGASFGVRLRIETQTAKGDVIVDVAAEYEAAQPFSVSRDVAFEFVNNVALMQLFPYIREAVASLTARVFGEALLLPVFMRGQVAFSPTDGPEISHG